MSQLTTSRTFDRLSASFEYVGPARGEEEAKAAWSDFNVVYLSWRGNPDCGRPSCWLPSNWIIPHAGGGQVLGSA